MVKYLNKVKNPYILKVDNMFVEFEYSKGEKRLNECIINILKQKKKMSR